MEQHLFLAVGSWIYPVFHRLKLIAITCLPIVDGVVVGDLQEKVAEYGLFYPPDPSSRNFVPLEVILPVMQGD